MKSIFYLSLAVLSFNIVFAGYGFDLICRTDTVQNVPANGIGYFTFTLTNTGTEPDVYELNCNVITIVPDWSVIYCLRGRCLEPGNPIYDSLQSGEVDTTIDITVYTTTTGGSAIVRLTARSLGNPSLNKAITTITIGSGAIAEGGAEYQLLPLHHSLIIDRQQELVVTGETAGLFDIFGRRVIRLRPGTNDLSTLSSGIYLLHIRRKWYKLLLL
ncbi:MAG: COG1470 family protein [bacterium]